MPQMKAARGAAVLVGCGLLVVAVVVGCQKSNSGAPTGSSGPGPGPNALGPGAPQNPGGAAADVPPEYRRHQRC